MNKKILLLCLMGFIVITASAATKYEINIAGVEVTSDNASRITGGDITSGYGVYNASNKTLTLYSMRIHRDGQDNYGIHNRKCDNLKIVFSGSCSIITADNALKLERSTTLESASGSSTTFYSSARICANLKSYNYYINGSGTFEFRTDQSGYEAIKGDGSSSTKVYFEGGKVYASSAKRSALSSFAAYFYNGNHLEVSSNGSNQTISDVTMQFNGNEKVISPYQAAYSSSAKSVCVGSTPITDKKIIISDDYVAILNSSYFPDQNFRTKLYNTYFSKGYINSTDVANTTTLNVSSSSISSLTGIGYFTSLKTLYCSSNNLASLPSLPNSITSLNCSSNYLTSLPTLPSGLTDLNCSHNKLSALPALPSGIKAIYANSNQLGAELYITGKSSLTTLDVSNNLYLYALYCYNNSLTSLSYSDCDLLRTLDCHNNKLTSLNAIPINVLNIDCSVNQLTSLPTLPSGLTELRCNNNQMIAFPVLPNAIKKVYAGSNKFSGTLSITGKSGLSVLDVSDNTSITTLNCSNNALTSLDISGCTALKVVYCNVNNLYSLSTLPSGITVLDCSNNQLTSLPELPSNISSLNVGNNSFTTLGIWGKTKLATLDCSSCTKLTSLDCANNALTSLNIANCSALTSLQINNNQIKSEAMGNIITSLPMRSSSNPGTFKVLTANYSGEGNVITTDQVKQARNKYWNPKQWKNSAWSNIVPGDVNGDGECTSSDVTALYNAILYNDYSKVVNGDQNGDNAVTSSDVTAVYNIILGL